MMTVSFVWEQLLLKHLLKLSLWEYYMYSYIQGVAPTSIYYKGKQTCIFSTI